LGISDCTPFGGCNAVNFNQVRITNYENQFPSIANNTFVRVADGPNTGLVLRAAGGALLGISDCTPFGGCNAVNFNQVSITNYENQGRFHRSVHVRS